MAANNSGSSGSSGNSGGGGDSGSTPATPVPERSTGRRGQPASAEDLVEYLEDISGKRFYTRQDLHLWLTEMRDTRKSRKYTLWLVALLLVFLQYQVIDIMIEVSSLRDSSIMPTSRTTGYRS
jgi:hypothetical protein